MKTVHKYEITPGTSVINMRPGPVLKVDQQGRCLFAWILLDTDAAMIARTFTVLETGQALPEGDLKHRGSVLMFAGAYVVHVFEHFD